jgi:hypothetical protein
MARVVVWIVATRSVRELARRAFAVRALREYVLQPSRRFSVLVRDWEHQVFDRGIRAQSV